MDNDAHFNALINEADTEPVLNAGLNTVSNFAALKISITDSMDANEVFNSNYSAYSQDGHCNEYFTASGPETFLENSTSSESQPTTERNRPKLYFRDAYPIIIVDNKRKDEQKIEQVLQRLQKQLSEIEKKDSKAMCLWRFYTEQVLKDIDFNFKDCTINRENGGKEKGRIACSIEFEEMDDCLCSCVTWGEQLGIVWASLLWTLKTEMKSYIDCFRWKIENKKIHILVSSELKLKDDEIYRKIKIANVMLLRRVFAKANYKLLKEEKVKNPEIIFCRRSPENPTISTSMDNLQNNLLDDSNSHYEQPQNMDNRGSAESNQNLHSILQSTSDVNSQPSDSDHYFGGNTFSAITDHVDETQHLTPSNEFGDPTSTPLIVPDSPFDDLQQTEYITPHLFYPTGTGNNNCVTTGSTPTVVDHYSNELTHYQSEKGTNTLNHQDNNVSIIAQSNEVNKQITLSSNNTNSQSSSCRRPALRDNARFLQWAKFCGAPSPSKKQKFLSTPNSVEEGFGKIPSEDKIKLHESYKVAASQILKTLISTLVWDETHYKHESYVLRRVFEDQKICGVLEATLKYTVSAEKFEEFTNKKLELEKLIADFANSSSGKLFIIYLFHQLLWEDDLCVTDSSDDSLVTTLKKELMRDFRKEYFTPKVMDLLINSSRRENVVLQKHEQRMDFIMLVASSIGAVAITYEVGPEQQKALDSINARCTFTGESLSEGHITALILFSRSGKPSIYMYQGVAGVFHKFVTSTTILELEMDAVARE